MSQGIAVLGLGKIGQALALALARRGGRVIAWNRTARDWSALADEGVRLAPDPAAALHGTSCAFLTLLDYESAYTLLQPISDLEGCRVVAMMSGTPRDARRLAGMVADRGGAPLEAALKKAPADMGREFGAVFYSGPPRSFEELKPTLSLVGGRCQFLGENIDAAKGFELATFARSYMWIYGYFHALAIAVEHGIDVRTFTDAMVSVCGSTFRYIDQCADQIASNQYAASTMATISVHHAALSHTLSAAKDLRLDLPILRTIERMMAAAIEAGRGGCDLPALYPGFIAAAQRQDFPESAAANVSCNPAQ